MSRLLHVWLWAFLVLLAVTGSASGDGWAPAEGSRRWSFPRDHGAHPEYRTEWWYFTGLLQDGQGRAYGYQFTIFRRGLRKKDPSETNPWTVRDLYAGHFALTGISAGRFAYGERISREGPGLAGWSMERFGARLLDWSMEAEGDSFRLRARDGGIEISLSLQAAGPPVLHGEGGLSRKGEAPGQASWYYSLPSMASSGTLRAPWTEGSVSVEGTTWYDHEFGSNQLSRDQAGWNWFSLRLDDGSALMIYLLRRTDGSPEPASSGTLVFPDRSWLHLKGESISLRVLGRWESERSGADYPSRWLIEIPDERIRLHVGSVLPDQELETDDSTGVTYWEGAVSGEGKRKGRPVRAEGYVELTGYAGSLGGLF